jgi:acylphosphatase
MSESGCELAKTPSANANTNNKEDTSHFISQVSANRHTHLFPNFNFWCAIEFFKQIEKPSFYYTQKQLPYHHLILNKTKMLHYNILVNGLVQGVYFRTSTVEEAEKLGVKGYVRNLDDTFVYVEAEGSEAALNELVQWCQKGPARADVKAVKVDKTSILKGYSDFSIRR